MLEESIWIYLGPCSQHTSFQNGKALPFVSSLGSTPSVTIEENCTPIEGVSCLDDPYHELGIGYMLGTRKHWNFYEWESEWERERHHLDHSLELISLGTRNGSTEQALGQVLLSLLRGGLFW